MEKAQGDRKTDETHRRRNLILAVKRQPVAKHNADKRQTAKDEPPRPASMTPTQPPKRGEQKPAAQSKNRNDNNQAHVVSLSIEVSGAGASPRSLHCMDRPCCHRSEFLARARSKHSLQIISSEA